MINKFADNLNTALSSYTTLIKTTKHISDQQQKKTSKIKIYNYTHNILSKGTISDVSIKNE